MDDRVIAGASDSGSMVPASGLESPRLAGQTAAFFRSLVSWGKGGNATPKRPNAA